MDNALLVDKLNSINDLQHVLNHLSFSQLEILINDSLKQLAARNSAAGGGTMTLSLSDANQSLSDCNLNALELFVHIPFNNQIDEQCLEC